MPQHFYVFCLLYIMIYSNVCVYGIDCRNAVDKLERQFERQLIGSVRSFIDATRRIVSTTSYVILVATATSFSLRVAAILVSRRLAVTSASPRRHSGMFDGEHDDQSVRVDTDIVHDVTDDEDVRCHCDVTEHRADHVPPPPSVNTRQSGIRHSLKYYETNV